MTALDPQVRIRVQNDSGMDIPPYSVVVITSVDTSPVAPYDAYVQYDSQDTHHVMRYDCEVVGNVAITGPTTIVAGDIGSAFFDQFLYVAIDESVSPPVSGEQWGPSNGSWVVTRGGVGFFAQGYSSTGANSDRSMFLRTFVRAAASKCSSSSSYGSSSMSSRSAGSTGSSGSTAVSGSSSSSSPCGCLTVVTAVSCSGGSLSVTYGSARGCC